MPHLTDVEYDVRQAGPISVLKKMHDDIDRALLVPRNLPQCLIPFRVRSVEVTWSSRGSTKSIAPLLND